MNLETRNELVLDSREVAKMIGKEHSHLLRDITKYIRYFNETKIGFVDFFQESQYLDSKGEKRKCYKITKKGCEFLAHKLTGKKGTVFTAKYIDLFHKMEEKLKEKELTGQEVMIPISKAKYWELLIKLEAQANDLAVDLGAEYKKMYEAITRVGEIRSSIAGNVTALKVVINKFEGK